MRGVMSRIIAKGIISGRSVLVEVYKLDESQVQCKVNGEHSEEFNDLIQNPPAMAGTYYPNPGSMMAALAVLQSNYFDEDPEIEVYGDIGKVPYVRGRVY